MYEQLVCLKFANSVVWLYNHQNLDVKISFTHMYVCKARPYHIDLIK